MCYLTNPIQINTKDALDLINKYLSAKNQFFGKSYIVEDAEKYTTD